MSFMNNSSMNSNIQDLSNQIIPETNPVHLFCESKGEINIPNEYGWTPLYRALVSNNIAAMIELLKLGADPNITNNMGETPLYQSVDNENFEAMTLLLENYADCNISKSDGMTPLHLAIKKNLKKEYVEKLLEFKANPNLKNRLYQQTPLHIAMKNKSDFDIIKLLLKYNADITIKDKYDATPLDCCEDAEYKKSIESILNSEENKVTDNTNNMINIIDTTPNKDSEIVSKFSSSEVIKGDFNSNTPNTFLVNNNELSNNLQNQINNITNSSNSKNEEVHSKYSSKTEIEHTKINNNNSLVSSDNKILKKNTYNNIIKTTPIYNPKQISKKPQTSTFNLSTPKENSCSSRKTNSINSNTYRENNIFTLENGMGSFLTIHSKKKSNLGSSDNKSGSKDMISEINPLEFINQVVTTTSNIFSELQNNTRDQQSLSQTKSDELVCEIKTPEKLDTKNKEGNNEDNNLNDSLEDHEMTYSKSKSYIVSELPITSMKKISPAKNNTIEHTKENEKEDYSSHKVNLFNIIQKPSALNKISYHQNRNTSTTNAASATNTTLNANKENNLNIINLPYNIQQDTSKCSSSDYFYIEDNERTTSNTPVIPNNKYLNSSGGINNNITDLDINNSNRDYNPYNKSSVNSTRPTTNPYNMNSNKVLNMSGAMKKQTISQLVMSPVYDGSTNSSNTNNNFNNYTLGGNSTYNSGSFRRHKKNSILTDYAVKTGQWNSTKIYSEEGEHTNKNTPSFLSKDGNINNYVDYRTKISAREAKRLHEWLLSADLLSYYNTLLDQGIYEIDKCIKGLSSGDLALSYKDIEDLGIRKPGHIYRFLLKMQCDSNMIDQRLVNYVIPNKTIGDGILRDSNCNINLGASQNCCGCAMIERRTVKELDIESWLRTKGLINLRENFLHNGFEVFEYVIIQMFSNYAFDENIITDCLHVYNAIDRKKLRLALLEEKRNICEKLGIKYLDMEMEDTNRETAERCQICAIF